MLACLFKKFETRKALQVQRTEYCYSLAYYCKNTCLKFFMELSLHYFFPFEK